MTLNFSQFLDNWPESRKDQFSYDALKAIFEYIESYEKDAGDEQEFDPIAICCEWTEYDSSLEAVQEYTGWDDVGGTVIERETSAREWLEEKTTVLDAGKGIVMIQV